MQKLFDFLPRETVKSIFRQVPPAVLIEKRTISKAWSEQVSQDEACSIIETTLRQAKQLFNGEISDFQQIRDQVGEQSLFSSSNSPIEQRRFKYHIKKSPSSQTATILFNSSDHFSFSDKAALASKFLNIPITDIKNALTGKEPSREHYEEFNNLGYDILDKSRLTTVRLDYDYDKTNSIREVKEISFKPIKKKGSLYVGNETIDRVKGFFNDQKVVIKPEIKPETSPGPTPEEHQPEKVFEKVQNQVNSFIGKHF